MKTYKALHTLLHDQLGRIEKGQEFKATDAQASGIIQFIEPTYKAKVVNEVSDAAKPSRSKEAPKTTAKRNS